MQVQLNQNLPDGLKEALPPSSSVGLNHWRMLTFLKDQTELTQGERFSEEEGNVMMKTLIESAASKRDVVVTPTRSPPSSAEVTKWLQSSLKRPRPPPASKEPASEKNSKEDEVSPPDSEISPMSCDKSGDLLRSPTATVAGEDPPSPFLQDLIDDIEPSTPPPMSDTPPSPLSCQTPQTLPCHSTPMTTGRTKKLNQPIVTPILVTSSKKNASKLKRRVSLVDPVKETRPRVVTPAQVSFPGFKYQKKKKTYNLMFVICYFILYNKNLCSIFQIDPFCHQTKFVFFQITGFHGNTTPEERFLRFTVGRSQS